MRAVQRVTDADVTVENKNNRNSRKGFVVLLGVEDGDAEKMQISSICQGYRASITAQGKTNLSIMDIGGEILSISQLPFRGCAKGKRPSFTKAAKTGRSQKAVCLFNDKVREKCSGGGHFQADMLVRIYNDGRSDSSG